MASMNVLSKVCLVLILALFSLVGQIKSEEQRTESGRYEALEVINKSASEIIQLRGFHHETHYVRTKDGYNIQVVRVINPLINSKVLKRPVIFNHGLLESATIWLVNSRDIQPEYHPLGCEHLDVEMMAHNDTRYINGPFMLSNHGYDVWLMSMRGTDWSQKHDTLSALEPDFWNYSLDDFALVDIPSVVDYVRAETGAEKVGYIGHSQATFSIFGLLSTRPNYANIIEPVIAVAPVAYMEHITSVARLLFVAALTTGDKQAPFPNNARRLRDASVKFCKKGSRKSICQLIETLVSGNGRQSLKGHRNHIPFFTSLKVLRHFGQLVTGKRYSMYDYGEEGNLKLYGKKQSPEYPVERIISESIVFVRTKNDALGPPEDVETLKKRFTVPLFKDFNIDRDINHLDLIINIDAGKLVFGPILEIFETFEEKTGICAAGNYQQVPSNDIQGESFTYN